MISELRIILLILGCLFIAALYCWEVFFRSGKKKKNEFLNAIDELPDSPSINAEHFDDAPTFSRSVINSNNILSQQVDADRFQRDTVPIINTDGFASETNTETDIPSLKKDVEAIIDHDNDQDAPVQGIEEVQQDISMPNINAFSTEQDTSLNEMQSEVITNVDSNESTEIVPDSLQETENEIQTEANFPKSNQEAGLIMLYITSPAQTMFNGLSISKAADEVGMVYGHMNIFHHFGPGKLHSGQPLFSMANMFEPGSFDLGRMADLRTKGIVLFMYSPASIEATVVFELYLNTARRIAEYLNGELRMSDNHPLDNTGIDKLREQAELLANNQAL